MDTNLLEGTIKEILLDDKLKVYVFDVFDDSVLKYTISNGKLTNCGSDTLANYLENIKTKIDSPYIPGFMNLVSIPKMKEKALSGNSKVMFEYQALDSKWYKITAMLINFSGKELIVSVREQMDNNCGTKEASDSKYNVLIGRIADAILKIDNVFNLDNSKASVNNKEDYIDSILKSIVNSYPDLKNSLNKNAANVSGRADDVILIIDDDMVMRKMIKKIFADEYKIVMAENGKEALEYLETNSNKGLTESSDNILGIFLDLTMPVMDGFAVLEYLSKNNYLYKIPVIIISGDYEKETKARVYNYGVADMLEKPFDFEVVKHRIGNFINLYKSSNSLNNLISDQSRDLKDLINPFVESYRYDYESNINSVNEYMKKLGTQVMKDFPEYNLDEEKINKMADASMYYDIGFYSIPRTILLKKDSFNESELKKIKNYPIFGEKMLNYVLSLTQDELYKKYAQNITKYYHENYNGSGYPFGLKENQIPLEVRIASVCINYNNLLKKYGNRAFDIIVSKENVSFSPDIISSFKKIKNELI